MRIPDTPLIIIAQLSDNSPDKIWNGAWKRFFDIYHATIRLMVSNAFVSKGWYDIPRHISDEVISDVVIALNKIFKEGSYVRGNVKFRHFLKRIVINKSLDYMRKNYKFRDVDSIEDENSNAAVNLDFKSAEDFNFELEGEEIRAYRQAVILDAYETIRHNFSPRNCMAFELVKLEGRSTKEVVQELGIDEKAINNAISRITKKLREVVLARETSKELK